MLLPEESACVGYWSPEHDELPIICPEVGSYVKLFHSIFTCLKPWRGSEEESQWVRNCLSKRAGDSTASYAQAAFSFGARDGFRSSL